MSRFTMVLAAAVATAMLVIAVSTLDAVGADPPSKASVDLAGKLADCLRGRGVAVPALTGVALDRWLQTHGMRIPEADGRACKTAIAPREETIRAAPSVSVKQLTECLRAQGFDVPSDPMALKQWIGEQRSPMALRALKRCDVSLAPGPDQAPAPCGEPKQAPSKPKATHPDPGAAEPVT
jgi:hypothetical protein